MKEEQLSEQLSKVRSSLREARLNCVEGTFTAHDSSFINKATACVSAAVGALKSVEEDRQIDGQVLDKDLRSITELLGELTSNATAGWVRRPLIDASSVVENVLESVYEKGHHLENAVPSQGKSHIERASR